MLRFAVILTEFKVEVGLYVIDLVTDGLTDDIRQESSWAMTFADGIVICSEKC